MKQVGKVYLVGAGPGDPGLVTVRAKELLNACDAIVYDRLVSLELVVPMPERVQRYFVGKSSSCHSMHQDEINKLLVKLAKQGMTVVRLKGGDPFVFGRGGEEALFLKENGISYEIVPGVTAGIAASAYAGIPITHRKQSVFTVLLTAHEAADKEVTQVPWEWLGKIQHGSIVGYMGVTQLPSVVNKLIEAGMDPNTPAALIERGTTGSQRHISATLADLPGKAAQEGIAPPALFIIGKPVLLSEELDWFGGGVLSGKRMMVTRPADQAFDMYALLREQGAEVLPLPTIRTAAHDDDSGWDEIKGLFELNVRGKAEEWIVFTSENGVRYFIQQLFDRGYDFRFLGRFKIAAMGTGTDRALRLHHLKADFLPTKSTSDVLAAEFSDYIKGKACKVIRVRGNLGDDRIEQSIEEADAVVLPLQVYDTSTAVWDAGMWACLDENPPDVITFTSGSTAAGFKEILGDRGEEIAGNAVIASIGPMTTQIITNEKMKVAIEAKMHSVPGLVEEILNYFRQHKA